MLYFLLRLLAFEVRAAGGWNDFYESTTALDTGRFMFKPVLTIHKLLLVTIISSDNQNNFLFLHPTSTMKLSFSALFVVVSLALKGHSAEGSDIAALDCPETMEAVAECMGGDGESECADCIENTPGGGGSDFTPAGIKKAVAMCTKDDQACASCAAELRAHADCIVEKMEGSDSSVDTETA